MATENTLKIRNIGLTKQRIFVKQPHKQSPVLLERMKRAEKVIHSGGTRIGKFE